MPHPLTLPALSVLALVGTGTGIVLGRSAISEINPAYYSDPEPRFHADLGPHRPSMEAPVYRAGALTAAEMEQALGTGCVNCRLAPGSYYPVYRQAESGASTDYALVDSAPAPIAAVQVEASPDPAEATAETEHAEALVRVHRYASYEVTQVQVATAEPQETAAERLDYAAAEVPLDD
jgi:hypothetical protein